ncbi:MAG: hypothetical protein WCJ09_13600 [Planctomycetota bacterium]
MDPSILPGFGTTSLQCGLRLTHYSYFIHFVNSADNKEFFEYTNFAGNTFYEVKPSSACNLLHLGVESEPRQP